MSSIETSSKGRSLNISTPSATSCSRRASVLRRARRAVAMVPATVARCGPGTERTEGRWAACVPWWRAGRRGRLLEAEDDATAVEVVGRQFDAHAIPGQDADAEAPHLAGQVCEDLVAHVELDAEVQVLQRLDDLAFELHLLFDGHGIHLLVGIFGLYATATGAPRTLLF